MTNYLDLKTPGLTHFCFQANQALFRTNRGVPVIAALSHASHLLHISKLLTTESTVARAPDLHAYASQYLQDQARR